MADWKYEPVFLRRTYDRETKGWLWTAGRDKYKTAADALNAYGSKGWELVRVVGEHDSNVYRDGIDVYEERYRAFFKAPA